MIFRGKVINRADHEKLKKEYASKDPTAPNKGQHWQYERSRGFQSERSSSNPTNLTNISAKKKNSNNKKLNKNAIPSKLKILYTNADSLSNKKDELSTTIKQQDIDIALVCETEPKNKASYLPSTPVIIDGYDSIENTNGRGVSVIYKENLEITQIEKFNNMYSTAVFIKLSNSNNVLHLAIIYRSPNSSITEDVQLNKVINLAAKSLKNLIIYGDFNHPEIDWKSMNCNKNEDHPASLFLHSIEDCKLDQLIE